MFEAFFGFKKIPFSDHPEPKQLFISPAWDQLRARLQFLVEHHAAGLLTGEVGSGKSTAARTFITHLNPSLYKVLYLHWTSGSALDLLRQLACQLDLEPAHLRGDLVRQISDVILRLNENKEQHPILICDEAHLLRHAQPTSCSLGLECCVSDSLCGSSNAPVGRLPSVWGTRPAHFLGFRFFPNPVCRSSGGNLTASQKDAEDVQRKRDMEAVEDAYPAMLLGIAPDPALLGKATDRAFRQSVGDMLQLLRRSLNPCPPWQTTEVPFSGRDILQIITALIENAAPVLTAVYTAGILLAASFCGPYCSNSSPNTKGPASSNQACTGLSPFGAASSPRGITASKSTGVLDNHQCRELHKPNAKTCPYPSCSARSARVRVGIRETAARD